MQPTPAHEIHNADLLSFIPAGAKSLIEIGCSSGALAREYKKLNPHCRYAGIEISDDYAELARRYCDDCRVMDIERADDDFWNGAAEHDCWIFGDTLEHFRDPWLIIANVAKTIPVGGHIIACIPNAQHWSLQARLNIGDFRYEATGLLDATHLRWFTRSTIIELFQNAGFRIEAGLPRIFPEPAREKYLPLIAEMAKISNADPTLAVNDALPLQYVVKAVRD